MSKSTPTSLLENCKEGNIDLVWKLLSSSCDLLACDKDKNTALHFAAEQGYLALVQELSRRYTALSAGKNIKGRTPHHLACMRGHSSVVEALAQKFPRDLEARDEYGDTPLHLAALFGHMETIELLCQQFHCDPSVKGHDDCTLLHYACAGGHLAVARRLIVNHGLDPLTQDVRGDTSLHYTAADGHGNLLDTLINEFNCSPHIISSNTLLHQAAAGGHWQLVQKLIVEYGLDPTHQDNVGRTAIHWVVGSSDSLSHVGEFRCSRKICSVGSILEVVEKLIAEYGCSVNARDSDGFTPLHIAAKCGREELVSELITKYKCSVDCVGFNCDTPLHWAAIKGHVGVVRMLLSTFGADVTLCNNKGYTALNLAALNGHGEIVGVLVSEFGCSASVKGQHGLTPLHDACAGGHLDVVEKLVCEYGCDVNAKGDDGLTPLHVAAAWCSREEVARELITKYKCPVNCADFDGYTPLHLATTKGNINIIRMLLSEYGADAAVCTNNGNTALNLAALNGCTEVVDFLISEFGCSSCVKGQYNRTPLHQACDGGHLDLVKVLVSEYGCDVNAKDIDGLTPLHLAAQCGREEVVRELITKYKCPVDHLDSNDHTPLHWAALKGHVGVVRMLLSEFGADVAAHNKIGATVLELASFTGHVEVVGVLISEFGCSPNVKGQDGRTPLHRACNGGHLDVIAKLVSEYGCDVNAKDRDGLTPLHVAALCGREEVVRELITKYKCPLECVDSDGHTPLHTAAIKGQLGVVRMLLLEFETDAAVRINNGNEALYLAALSGHAEVLSVLISEFGCNPSVVDSFGQTPLHQACSGGHLDVVEKLISEYGCDVNAEDTVGLTPLHVAAKYGREEVVRVLVTKCPVDYEEINGFTPLHWAALEGHVGVVRILLSVNAVAFRIDTVMDVAAQYGRAEIVGILINEFGCSPNVKNKHGQTPLHHACGFGDLDVVMKLVTVSGCDVNARDNDGRTPLHYACATGDLNVVMKLVTASGCDVNARDSDGHTPLYFAVNIRDSSIVAELVRHNSDLKYVDAAHKKLLKSAKKLSKNVRTSVFVVGIPEVGKSTLVKALQSETFFLQNVKKVTAHTAGIVPVFHESSSYGWVVFYDFAGDEEYYSSHAAILERIMGSSNLFLLVFDLSKFYVATEQMQIKYAENSIYYWLTFLSYVSNNQQEGSRLQVVLIGSHADVVQKEGQDADKILSEIFTDISQSFYAEFPETHVEMFGYVTLNCCLTKSTGLRKIKTHLQKVQLSSLTNAPQLTAGGSILLGTLEKGFQGRDACQVKEIIEHVKSHDIYLPPEAEQLHSYLKELHTLGLVLLLESSTPREDEWTVLNLPLFLSTVHKKLFTIPLQHADSLSNLGIIPCARLQTIFPEFSLVLLKDCLTLLQYCQEINDSQIILKVLKIPTVESYLNKSVLFFPALLKTNREDVKWIRLHSSLCCIGWYAECFRTYDFFPPRFLHVLLLRLAFTFALPRTSSEFDNDGVAIVDLYSRKCTLWKNGIHWLMESGVEVVVEVVKQKRAVLVMVRGSSDQQIECGDILGKVVAKVVEAKSEFCNILKANVYIASPVDIKQSTIPEMDQLQLFEARNVQEILMKGSVGAVSRDGKGYLPTSDLICLQTQTPWGKFE